MSYYFTVRLHGAGGVVVHESAIPVGERRQVALEFKYPYVDDCTVVYGFAFLPNVGTAPIRSLA